MHYFRYRTDSELSFKELIYNELYFTSQTECNDPFDSKSFYEFPNDMVRWQRLLGQALKIDDTEFKNYLINELAKHLCGLPVITFEKLLNEPFLDVAPLNVLMQSQTLKKMENAVRDFVKIYLPPSRWFASFSRSSSDILMWSHYANSHRGFCLIFQPIGGELRINHLTRKRNIVRQTPRSFAQQMSFSLPEVFSFTDIDYCETVEPQNAFRNLTAHIYGNDLNDEQRLELIHEQDSHFRQKGRLWQYEEESRLILKPPPSFLVGEHVNYTAHERLFQYDSTQLVGIIVGAKMPDKERERIRHIIQEKKDRDYWGRTEPHVLFDFVLHEARLSSNQRSIIVEPIEIIGAMNCKQQDEQFARRYLNWEDGKGTLIDGNSGKSFDANNDRL